MVAPVWWVERPRDVWIWNRPTVWSVLRPASSERERGEGACLERASASRGAKKIGRRECLAARVSITSYRSASERESRHHAQSARVLELIRLLVLWRRATRRREPCRLDRENVDAAGLEESLSHAVAEPGDDDRIAVCRKRETRDRVLVEQVGDVRLQRDPGVAHQLEVVRQQQVRLVERRRATQVATTVEVDWNTLEADRGRLEESARRLEVSADRRPP